MCSVTGRINSRTYLNIQLHEDQGAIKNEKKKVCDKVLENDQSGFGYEEKFQTWTSCGAPLYPLLNNGNGHRGKYL